MKNNKTSGRVAIYCRVSTEDQDYSQQINACTKFCEIKEWDDYEVFREVESTRKDRPILNQVIISARKGMYDTIIVFRLDRAWRSSRQFIMDFDSLSARGVNVISVMEGLDPTTPIGKAMMTILVALAELERENISQATKQRLQALKNMGKTLGRPKGSKDNPKIIRHKAGYYGNINAKGRKKSKKEKRPTFPPTKGRTTTRENRYYISDGTRWVLRSHIIMEKKIGRKLNSDEVVHHKNNNTMDDRPENLELMTNSNHVKSHHQKRNKQKGGV